MKFGYLEFLQLPKPWGPDSEHRAWKEGLDRIECADRAGIDHFWEVEHHFLEEYAGSSASESFLTAASQRTKRIRLGSGVTLVAPPYNHPARVAERVAALDLMSDGRAEFGTGESTAFAELDAFHVTRAKKRAMWRDIPRDYTHDGRDAISRVPGKVFFDAAAQRCTEAPAKAASSGLDGGVAPGNHPARRCLRSGRAQLRIPVARGSRTMDTPVL